MARPILESTTLALIFAGLTLICVGPAQGQIATVDDTTSTPIPGVGHDYLHLLAETVDPASGDVSLRIQIPTPKGRGISLPFSFSYDSNAAQHLAGIGNGLIQWQGNQSAIGRGGWSYAIPYLTFSNWSTTVTTNGSATCYYSTNYLFADANGVRHTFDIGSMAQFTQSGSPQCFPNSQYPNGGDGQFNAKLTRDCSQSINCPSGESPLVVVGIDGTTYSFLGYDYTGEIPLAIDDRNGNQITAQDSGNGIFTFTDTLGRTVLSSTGFGTSGNTYTLTVPGQAYQVTWSTLGANLPVPASQLNSGLTSGSNCFFSPGGATNSQPVISSITLPNGKKYQFFYDGTYGLINQIIYPTGGWVKYTWKMSDTVSDLIMFAAPGNSGYCAYEYAKPVVASRQVSFTGTGTDLTQTFQYNTPSWGATGWTSKTTTVQATDAVSGQQKIVYTYAPVSVATTPYPQFVNTVYQQIPVENQITYSDWNNTSQTLLTVNKGWYGTNFLECEFRTWAGGSASGSFYQYNYGQVSDHKEYDYSQLPASSCYTGAPLPTSPVPARETVTSFQSFTGPASVAYGLTFGRPTSIVTSGASTAETDYVYDGVALSSVTATQHDDPDYGKSFINNRGNVTTKTRKCFGCTDAVTTYTYDMTGQVLSRTDPCAVTGTCSDMSGANHTTTFSYTDNYSSGTAPGATNAYLTTITDALGHATTFAYGYNDGQLTSSTDANGSITNYKYNTPPTGCSDGLDRLSEIDYPDTGKTTYCYNDAAFSASTPSPSITTTKTITSGLNETTTVAFDGMGHAVQSILSSDPDGSTSVETQYTGMGNVHKQSNPHRASASSTDGTTTTTYDGMGRIIGLTRPDGSDVDTSYSGNCVSVTDEIGTIRRSCSDGLGRLIEVDEPGSGGQTEVAGSETATVSTNTNGEQSKLVPATHSSGTYGVGGNPPPPLCGTAAQGYITISVSGSQVGSAPYYWNSTQSSVGLALISSINNNGNSPVTATGGNIITLTSKATGLSTNYAVSAQPPSPTGQCTSMAIYGPTQLAGGTDAHTDYDSGSIVLTVNGVVTGVDYGQYDSTTTVTSALIAAINSNASSPVSASPNGSSGITLTANDAGASSDYTVSTSVFWSTSLFSQPSFTISAPSALSGGQDSTLGTGALVTLYTYNAQDDLTCAVQKGSDTTTFTTCAAAPATWRPRSFVYDSLSRLTSAKNPESGTILYTYDTNGNVSTKTAPAPNHSGGTVQTTYSYDVLNRLIKTSYGDGSTPTVQYGYDAVALTGCTVGPPSLTDPYPVGTRTAMCDGSGATSWSHDKMGRPATLDRNVGGFTRSATYQYNLDGSLFQETTFSGKQLQYTYGGAGRVLSLTDPSASPTYNFVTNATYAPNGSLASAVYAAGSTGFNGFTETDLYNSRLQPTVRFATSSAGTAISLCYDFHLRTAVSITSPVTCSFGAGSGDNGNVFQITNNRDTTRSQSFTYDALNRITSGSSTGPWWGTTYTIDAWGNLTNANGITGKTNSQHLQAAPANNNNQLNGFCHDVAGNLVFNPPCPTPPWSSTFYVYDAENRLKTAGGAVYVYDGDGNRVEKLIGGAGTLYWRESNGELTNETDTNNVTLHRHVYFDGRRLARTDTQPTYSQHFYFSDHLGSANVVANGANGTIEEDSDYYPYGGELVFTNNVPQNYKFTGKERDTESGLDMFGARYYSSSLGRFMTPDWAAKPTAVPYASFGNPQSLNLYSYVNNNPTTTRDPDGHVCEVCDLTIEAIDKVAKPLIESAVGVSTKAGTAVLGAVVGVAAVVFTSTPAASTKELEFEAKAAAGGNGARDGGNKTTAVSPGPDGMKPGSANPDGAGKPFNQPTKNAARAESDNKCVFCGKQTTSQPGPNQSNIDHSIPRSQGGDNSLDNAQNTCRTCNLDKGARTTEEYLKDRKPQ